MTDTELKEAIARIIAPDWFWHEEYGLDHSPLNNFPGQDLGYQERARERAQQIIKLVRDNGP